MTTALLLLVVAAALACPLHMLWAMRRGKRPVCCPPRKTTEVDVLRARQRALAEQLARAGSPIDGRHERQRDASV